MFRFFIDNEEVVCESSFEIKEEFTNPSSLELYKVYPKKWKGTNKLLEEYYFPKDYSKCNIYDFNKTPKPIYGIGKQKTTKGYQLFDESKLPSKTQNGVTLTNNGDGSFTISGSGNPTANFNYNYNYTHEETVELLKAGNITISDNGNTEYITSPYFLAQLRKSSGVIFEISNRALNVNTNIITQEMLDDESTILRIGFYGSANQIITPSTVKPMLFQEGDGKFEKFTGGKPSPNLDYPQEIETLKGTKNLFNGILKLGSINNNTGDYESSNNCIMGEQYIEVIPNNKYSISTSENYSIFVHFYDIDKNYISYDSTQKTPKIITIPDNCYYIRIRTRQAEKITDLNSKIQVEKGEINHDYVPFGSWLKLTTKFEEYKEKEYLIDMNKENLFNKDNLQINKLVNEQGILLDDTRYNSTDFIGVTNEISIYFDGKINNYNKMFVSEYDKNKNFIRRQTNSITTKLQQYFELDDNTQYIIFSYRHDVEMSNIRIYKGYGQNYELAGINDIKDELIVDDLGNVSLEKRIEKIILNSSHVKNLTTKYTNTIRFDFAVLTDSAIVSRNKLMCDSLPVSYGDTSDTEHIRNSDSQYSTSLCLYINKDRLEDTSSNTAIVNSFKKYLDEHEINVYYELKETRTIMLNKLNLINNLVFSGIVKNSADMELNPFKPHYCSVQILAPSILLSEGTTLDYVIADKTVREAITQVISSISDYGFVEGNISIPEEENTIIGAYSTLDKAPYDVFQYFSQISGTRWGTRMVDENTTAIDFYSPELLDNLGTIEVSKKYCVDNKIEELNYDYSTADYRNKQIITSEQVFANISTANIVISNGYDTTFILEQLIGKINSIEVNGVSKTFATKDEKGIGVTADFYYEVASNQLEANDVYSAGSEITVNYTAIVQGREITYNTSEIQRINNNLGRNGTISRYENRTDVTSSSELQSVGKTYIKYNSNAELSINIIAGSDFLKLGGKYKLDSPVSSINGYYLVRAKNTNVLQSGDFTQIKYEYELNSNFNTENELNFFDNQRAKANGNISQGEYISRNIDIEDTATIIFSDLQIYELVINSNNTLESNLETPLMD